MNKILSRRNFVKAGLSAFIASNIPRISAEGWIMGVNGRIPLAQMGTTLVHEHFLVDFIGAEAVTPERWQRDEVVKKVLPYLMEAKKRGVNTILDCTPAFLGRDPLLQRQLADASGLQIITNAGYYGAVNNKYLPKWAYTETADQLATRWITEFENGIDGTSIKPGFIKISVDGDHLSDLHQKLVIAAARTHLKTGLTICSHTGPAVLAFEELELLRNEKVDPSAFVWTHAQNEKEQSNYLRAAKMGTWISLDGLGWGEFANYADKIDYLKSEGLLHRVLISHDAGWYKPGEPDGGSFTGFTNIFDQLIPLLRNKGLSDAHFHQLLTLNPADAFSTRVRKLS